MSLRRISLAIAMLTAASLPACERPERAGFAPAPIRVSATVNVAAPPPDAAERVAGLAGMAGETFRAEGRADDPADGSGAVQRRAMARAAARREALRDLAERVFEYRGQSVETAGDFIRALPGGAEAIESWIEEAAQVSYTDRATGADASARLPGDGGHARLTRLVERLPPGTNIITRPLSPERVRELARRRAADRARAVLFENLLDAQTREGTVRSLIARDPRVESELRAMIAALEPESYDFTPNGRCTAILLFDSARLDLLIP